MVAVGFFGGWRLVFGEMMNRGGILLVLCVCWSGGGASSGWAQPVLLSDVQQQELDDIRHLLSRDDAQTRVIGARKLIDSSLPGRDQLVREVLTDSTRPGAALAMCEAICHTALRAPERLSGLWVDALLGLLGRGGQALSGAAARALAVFPDEEIPKLLGGVAGDESAPAARRLAAIDALALQAERQSVVHELVSLLGSDDARVVSRALAAIRPASRVDYGDDVAAWRQWWARQSRLTPAAWLRDQLKLANERLAALSLRFETWRKRAEARDKLVSQRVNDLLLTIYQLSPQAAQRQELIRQWLEDGLPGIRRSALALIRAELSEGVLPGEAVRDAIRSRLSDEEPAVRIAALDLIGNLKDPEDAPVLLDRLEVETDDRVRESIFRVLGLLGNPKALDRLLLELRDDNACRACVAQAARSLGKISPSVPAPALARAIEPMRRRLHDADADDVVLQEALLQALAMIGSAELTPEFADKLSSERPELIIASLRGLAAVGATAYIDRILSLLNHVDPRVRQLAAEAVGKLGGEAQLEALLQRLTPGIESNDSVREAAWEAFLRILLKTPAAVQVRWMDRLVDVSDRQVQLMRTLIGRWEESPAPPEPLWRVREQLADRLIERGDWAGAIEPLRRLAVHFAGSSPERSIAFAARFLDACVEVGQFDRLAETVADVGKALGQEARQTLGDALAARLRALVAGGGAETARKVVDQLRSLPDDALGAGWKARFDEESAGAGAAEGESGEDGGASGTAEPEAEADGTG